MKQLLTLFLLTGATLFAQQDSLPANSLPTQTKTVDLGPFINLKVYSGITTKLIPSTENKLVITSEDPNSIIYRQKGQTLKIRISLAKLIELPTTYIEIHYNQKLDLIDLSQGSSMEAEGMFDQTSLRLKVQEGSQFTGAFKVLKLTSLVASGGQAFLSGTADSHDLSVNSGGTCEAETLVTEQSMVNVTAGGVAYVNATGLMDATVTFNGTIRVYGTPTKLITKKNIGGKIIEME
jgi:hypothetical protein